MIKRLFDLIAAVVLLILLIPLMIILVMTVWINLGCPVVFKQRRPGYQGNPFYLYKFRTMNDQRDRQGRLLPDEERLTALGARIRKLSLDELPQLINVLRGDMSLVGPRPLLMEYLERYDSEQARRHEVKPGITGWAQVKGRNAISWEEKFAHDVWYVDNRSLWLDLKILWLTLLKVFKADGTSFSGYTTMPEFQGSESNKKRKS